jgi:hypothetical protein
MEGKFASLVHMRNLLLKCRELDPHGATGEGNPVGGNVTSDITGSDEPFAEWMVIQLYPRFPYCGD